MVIDKLLQDRRDEILRIAASHGARNVRVFGSFARGEAGPDSKIDILVNSIPTGVSWTSSLSSKI